MVDNKSNEDNPFGDFNDEFDFGEEIPEVKSPPPAPSGGPKGPNKVILLVALSVVVLLIGYFGYKFIFSGGSETASSTTTPTEAQLAVMQKPETLNQNANQAPIIKETVKREIIQTESKTSADNSNKVPKSLSGAEGFSENDIAKAFESLSSATEAGKPKTTPPTPATAAKAPGTTNATGITSPQVPESATTGAASKESKAQLLEALKGKTTESPNVPSTAEAQTTQGPAKTAETKTAESNGNIHELQKELFTPQPPTQAAPKTHPTEPSQAIKRPPIETEQLAKTVESLTQLNKQMENNLNQIKYLEAYTKEITETVTKLNSQISAMDNRILALTNTANSLSKDVGTVRTEVGQVKQVLGDEGVYIETPVAKVGVAAVKEVPIISNVPKKCTGVIVESPEYTLHAVIPGRAWLKSSTGQIITVTEGEVLGNYGKVLVIDAANSIVLTNSGVTFR